MKKQKQLGICMDHSSALIMELTNNMIISTEFESESIKKIEIENEDNHEIKGKEEQQTQSAYYKRISDIIRNYEAVLLFGPTDAKNELFNLIKVDHDFDNILIELRTTDKMTENQMFAFVKDFFKSI